MDPTMYETDASNRPPLLADRSDAWLIKEGRRLRHRVKFCRRAIGEAQWEVDVAQLDVLRAEWRRRHPSPQPAQRGLLAG